MTDLTSRVQDGQHPKFFRRPLERKYVPSPRTGGNPRGERYVTKTDRQEISDVNTNPFYVIFQLMVEVAKYKRK